MADTMPKPLPSSGSPNEYSTSNSLVQVGSLIGTHALAASIKDRFNVGSKANDSYASVAVYKSKGADPELSRHLTKSITVVERQVHSTRASFQRVHRIINDPGLALCRDSTEHKSLLDEWQEIELVCHLLRHCLRLNVTNI